MKDSAKFGEETREMPIGDYCVSPEDTVLRAVQVMDRTHTGIALVVDGDQKLIGVVADGDIRRAILEGFGLEGSITKVMTEDPVVIRNDTSDQEIVRLLQSEEFADRTPAWIPVVDGSGSPVALRAQKDLSAHVDRVSKQSRPAVTPARVLVIGGAGFIGSLLVRRLVDSGYSVTVLDRLLYGEEALQGVPDGPQFQMVRGDTRHLDDLVPLIRKVDAVVHLAELVGDPLCGRDPQTTFEINYLATASIARICDYLQINRFIYLSSCSVYGASSDPDEILAESSALAPVSLYAKTKINSERVILDMGTGNFSPCILRLGTVFGISDRPRFDLVVNTLTARAVQEGDIRIFGGNQWRPHVHVGDVARAIQLALEAPLETVGNQVFNIVGENHRIGDVASMILEAIPDTKAVYEKGEVDERNYRVSSEKAAEVLGFQPSVSVRDGIREVAQALRDGTIRDYRERRYTNLSAFVDFVGDGSAL